MSCTCRHLAFGCAALITCSGADWLAAAPIAGASTLQDLINTGSAGITIDGLRFHSFAYTGTTAGGVVPSASQIGVSDVSGLFPDTSGEPLAGIRFSFGWSAIDGEVVDSQISYRVAVTDSRTSIGGVDLQFNGSAFPIGHATFATVAETVQRSDGKPIVGNSGMGVLNVFNDGAGGLSDTNAQFLDIAPCTELIVTKDITLRAGPIGQSNDPGGLATISWVDNGYATIPEPGSGALILIPAVALLMKHGRSVQREQERPLPNDVSGAGQSDTNKVARPPAAAA